MPEVHIVDHSTWKEDGKFLNQNKNKINQVENQEDNMNDNISFRNGPVLIMEGHDSENYHMHDNATELIWILNGEAGKSLQYALS